MTGTGIQIHKQTKEGTFARSARLQQKPAGDFQNRSVVESDWIALDVDCK